MDAFGDAGMTALEQVATDEAEIQTSLRPHLFGRLRRQAELQHRARITEHVFELLPLAGSRGCRASVRATSTPTSRRALDVLRGPYRARDRGAAETSSPPRSSMSPPP